MNNTPCIEVMCRVDNCKYNENDICHAEELRVNVHGDGFANSSAGTCCETFKPVTLN